LHQGVIGLLEGANFGGVYFLGPRTIPSEGCSCELSAVIFLAAGEGCSKEGIWAKTTFIMHYNVMSKSVLHLQLLSLLIIDNYPPFH
jgi:hypothetical protein